jgi:glyceraldehyde 3-phosphate dehydrogenase
MPTRVAINGFGRIGRNLVRAAHERHAPLEIVAVNDVTDAATLAQLLAFDSVYGRFAGTVRVEDDTIVIDDGPPIRVLSEREPGALPWAELGVEVAIEATGKFRTRAAAAAHLEAGARKVIITAPAKGSEPVDADLVLGVNFDSVYDPDRHHVVTCASCTTNCLAPIARVLHDAIGIRYGVMTTIHSYTADQNLLDGPHKDMRRARAAALNLVPTTTGAARAVELVIPELKGRLDGLAVRVPTPTGSIVDLTFEAERATTVHDVNAVVRNRADVGELRGILLYSEDPIVSSDIVGSPYSAIFDAPLTMVVGGKQVKVIAWYDNEWGYSNRVVEMAERMLVPVHA